MPFSTAAIKRFGLPLSEYRQHRLALVHTLTSFRPRDRRLQRGAAERDQAGNGGQSIDSILDGLFFFVPY